MPEYRRVYQLAVMRRPKKRRQINIVQEAQQNSRWFLGYRLYSTYADMTRAEFSRMFRGSGRISKTELIVLAPILILLAVLAIFLSVQSILNKGFSLEAALAGGAGLLLLLMISFSFYKYHRQAKDR